MLAAHGVWVSEPEIAVLRKRGVGVSHNPESNMKLASGTAPVPAYLAPACALGLGTDGAASNNDLDMFEAMRHARRSCTSCRRATRAPCGARRRWRWRRSAARARSAWTTQIGSLEPGKRADVIVVGMAAARQTPMYDPISHLVYVTRGDDVRTTIVNGKVLMRDGKVLTLRRSGGARRGARLGRQGARGGEMSRQ